MFFWVTIETFCPRSYYLGTVMLSHKTDFSVKQDLSFLFASWKQPKQYSFWKKIFQSCVKRTIFLCKKAKLIQLESHVVIHLKTHYGESGMLFPFLLSDSTHASLLAPSFPDRSVGPGILKNTKWKNSTQKKPKTPNIKKNWLGVNLVEKASLTLKRPKCRIFQFPRFSQA